MKSLKWLGLISLVVFASCGQFKTRQQVPRVAKKTIPNWKSYAQNNFAVQYPPEWELDQTGVMGTSFVLFSPLESDNDDFKENINLLIQDLRASSMSLAEFTSLSEKQVKKSGGSSAILESKTIRNGPEVFQRLIYTGDQGTRKLKFEQYYWVNDDKAYILTLSCTQDNFQHYKELGETILNSFDLKNI